jgi:hypothetical protein
MARLSIEARICRLEDAAMVTGEKQLYQLLDQQFTDAEVYDLFAPLWDGRRAPATDGERAAVRRWEESGCVRYWLIAIGARTEYDDRPEVRWRAAEVGGHWNRANTGRLAREHWRREDAADMRQAADG